MGIFKKQSKEERIENRERKRIHQQILQKEYEFSKQDKIPPKGYFVSLHNINKIYDNHVQAVYDFNLDIKPKEFIVFVGPSGCGKSTTLRMIAGLEDITYGDLFINGMYANDLQPKDRDIAMVFQSYALYPHYDVFDNLAFGLKIRKVPTLKIDKKKYNEQLRVVVAKEKELYKLRDDLSLLKKAAAKNDDDSLKDKISAKQEEYDAIEKVVKLENEKLKEIGNQPVLGIDHASIRKIKKDIAYYTKMVKRFEKENEKLVKKSEGNTLEAETCKHLIEENNKKLKMANESLERTMNSLNYYEKTEVPIYKNKHLSKREIRQTVENAAKILDLGEYLDRKPNALSGGQCQRVALGRAIVRNSKLFLMDEPLSNLDAKLRVQMRSEIVKLHNRLGTTTIYVTHDQTEAMTMATRIVVMSKGHIQQIGEPKEIYNHPANIFVASFIGSPAMNIFDVTYDNGTLTVSDKYKLKLSKDYIKAHNEFYQNALLETENKIDKVKLEKHAYEEYQKNLAEKKVKKNKDEILNDQSHYEFNTLELRKLEKTLASYEEILKTNKHVLKMGIRPEDIVRVEDKTSKHVLSAPFKENVTVSELLGHEYYVHFNIGAKEVIAKTQGNDNIQIGDEIEFAFNLPFLHLFDEISTKLIK